VAQFTDTLAGVIKGDAETFGAVKSNTDGTGSVNGLDDTGGGTKVLTDDGTYNYPLNYSANEVKVGTWIDGKPIYKKTYTNSFSNTKSVYITEVIDSAFWTSGKRLIKVEGLALRNGDTLRRSISMTWIGTAAGTTDECFAYDCTQSGGLYLNCLMNTGGFTWGVYTTAYYTKTTD
jgi:hypothetical protein